MLILFINPNRPCVWKGISCRGEVSLCQPLRPIAIRYEDSSFGTSGLGRAGPGDDDGCQCGSLQTPVYGAVRQKLDRAFETSLCVSYFLVILSMLCVVVLIIACATCTLAGYGTDQLNLLRCFIMPVAYGIFLAVAQLFLVKPSNVRRDVSISL